MKKIFLYMMLAGTLSLAGCSQEELIVPETEQNLQGEKITFKAEMPQPEGESRLIYDDEALTLKWSEGDCLSVTGYNNSNQPVGNPVTFTLESGAGSTVGIFSGIIPENVKQGATLYLLTTPNKKRTQVQLSNGDKSVLQKDITLRTPSFVTYNSLKQGIFKLRVDHSILKLTINSLPDDLNGADVHTITWTNNERNGEEEAIKLFLAEGIKSFPYVAYIAFSRLDIEDLEKGNKIAFTLDGNKRYKVSAISANGKSYSSNKQYTVTISKDTPGTLSTWELAPDEDLARFAIKTIDGRRPDMLENINFRVHPRSVNGYWYVYNTYNNRYNKPLKSLSLATNTAEYKELQKIVTEIILPNSITRLDNAQFYKFEQLESCTIPASLTQLPARCFEGDTKLKSVTFPENCKITVIPEDCFMHSGLERVDLPEGIKSIEGQAFSSCTSLTQLTIPSTVETIKKNAFNGAGLETITLPKGNLKTLERRAFSNNKSLKKMIIRTENQLTVGEELFGGLVPAKTVALEVTQACADANGITPSDTPAVWGSITWKSITIIP